MSAKEAEIWADAEPLESFFSKLLAKVDIGEAGSGDTANVALHLDETSPFNRVIAGMGRSLAMRIEQQKRRENALAVLERILVRVDVSAIGLVRDDGALPKTITIPPSFWIDASISPELGEARNGGLAFSRIRIFQNVRAKASTEEIRKIERSRRGPTSYETIIRAAIEELASRDNQWWTLPPIERHQEYRKKIKHDRGIDTIKVRGFSASKFEEVEKKVRRSSY